MDVPDVYVHPPEEEQCDTPTWCYFNSADPHADSTDTSEESDADALVDGIGIGIGIGASQSESVDLAELRYKLETEQAYYPSAQDAPVFHRDVIEAEEIVMPRRSSVYYQTRPEFGLEMLAETSFEYRADEEEQEARREKAEEERREAEREARRERNRAQEEDVDIDIAEVVKVRRRDVVEPSPEEESQMAMKRSKTLKGRATLALRTIKNAGKRTRKTSMKENAKSADVQQVAKEPAGEVEGEQTPKLSRRKSRPISLFFPFSNSEPSVPQSSAEPTHLPASYSSNPPPRPPRSIRRTVSHAATLQTASPLTSPSLESDSSSRGNSPYLLDGVQSAPRRRFSFANLQSLFTSSTSPSSSVTDLAGPTDGSLPSSAEPETPTDDGFIIPNIYTKPAPMIESLDSADIQEARRISSQSRPSMQSMMSRGSMGSGHLPIASMMERKESYGREPEAAVDVHADTDAVDEGFEPEMRLDSLHFESLRFDPETFDVDAYLRSDV